MARAWTLALAVAMLMTGGAEAGFTKTGKITGNARKRLENGTVYTVAQDELSVKGSSGWSGLYLDANSTAVLYIPAGMTLKVTGGSASDRTGAGAGIEIPPSSTLIVTGGGTLEAYGGMLGKIAEQVFGYEFFWAAPGEIPPYYLLISAVLRP